MNKGRFKGFLPSIIWTIVIVILSVLPGGSVKPVSFLDFWNVDKLGHLGVYMIHSYLILVGFWHIHDKSLKPNNITKAFLLSIALGVSLEVTQHFLTQDRQFDLLDMLANSIGTLLGLMVFKLLHK